jgi:hypothetical protein
MLRSPSRSAFVRSSSATQPIQNVGGVAQNARSVKKSTASHADTPCPSPTLPSKRCTAGVTERLVHRHCGSAQQVGKSVPYARRRQSDGTCPSGQVISPTSHAVGAEIPTRDDYAERYSPRTEREEPCVLVPIGCPVPCQHLAGNRQQGLSHDLPTPQCSPIRSPWTDGSCGAPAIFPCRSSYPEMIKITRPVCERLTHTVCSVA